MRANCIAMLVLSCCFLAGCGGGGNSVIDSDPFAALTAGAAFQYSWAAAAHALTVELFYQGKPVGTQTATRIPGTAQATVTFTRLYPNNITFRARTYATAGAAIPLKEGWGALRARANQTKTVTLVQDVPVAELYIFPRDPLLSPGQSVQLTAESRSEAGAVVLDAPGVVTWKVSDDAGFTVTAGGLVTASGGGGWVNATHTPSGMGESVSPKVLALPGASGTIAFTAYYDGFEYTEPGMWPDLAWNNDIYLMRADGTDLKRMTTNFANDTTPAVSPDGGLLVFASNRLHADQQQSDLFCMHADGSGQQLIVRNAANPEILSNGTLTFQRGDGLYTANVNGGGQQKVFTIVPGMGFATMAVDGTVAYVAQGTGQEINLWELHVRRPGSTAPTQLTFGDYFSTVPFENEDIYAPAFSPDGKTIAFARGHIGLSSGLYLINTDGTNKRMIINTFFDVGSIYDIAFSPDGTWLLFTTTINNLHGTNTLHAVKTDGTGLVSFGMDLQDGAWGRKQKR